MSAIAPDDFFPRRAGVLYAEDLALPLLAQAYGTPLYVYSRSALIAAWQAYAQAIVGHDTLICYAVKANSSLAVLRQFRDLGAGFDVVSGGELARVLAIGADPAKIFFSGVGKSRTEIIAALEAGIACFNIESSAELARVAALAVELGTRARVSLRVNPDVDAGTHPYISTGLKENKFGIDIADAPDLYAQARALPGLEIVGVDCHIGSQICSLAPYLDALHKVLDLLEKLSAQGINLRHLDIGGGLGIKYQNESAPAPADLLREVYAVLRARGMEHLQLVLEPGRSLVGNCGLLLTTVEYLKPGAQRNFAIVDAAMNDLMRPALYDAWHDVQVVAPDDSLPALDYDVVGPVCESGDWLAKRRKLALREGELLAILSAGAYASSMASNYNSRARAAEVLVCGSEHHLLRPREGISSLFAAELVPSIF